MTSPVRLAGPLALASVLLALPASAVGAVRYRDDVTKRVTRQSDVRYGQAPGADGRRQALRLDVYQPRGDRARNRRAFLYVHGGGFTGGDRADGGSVAIATHFARKGYVAISVGYRLLGIPNGGIPAAQYDAQAAVRWVRRNARRLRVDTRAISIAGSSAGAITALRVAYNSEDPGRSGNRGWSSKVRAVVSDAGIDAGLDVDRGEPPALLLHGTADTLLRYADGKRAWENIRRAGVFARLVTYPGAGHTALAFRPEQGLAEITRFLLANGGPATVRRRG